MAPNPAKFSLNLMPLPRDYRRLPERNFLLQTLVAVSLRLCRLMRSFLPKQLPQRVANDGADGRAGFQFSHVAKDENVQSAIGCIDIHGICWVVFSATIQSSWQTSATKIGDPPRLERNCHPDVFTIRSFYLSI